MMMMMMMMVVGGVRRRRMTMKKKSVCSSRLVQVEETAHIKGIGTVVPVHS
jgi:hypothetical protein